MNIPHLMSISDFLKLRLNPVGEELSRMGAMHLIVAYCPNKNAIHLVTSAAPADQARACEELAAQLQGFAAQLKKNPAQGSLVLPNGVQIPKVAS